jgi:DNA repair protein RadC
MAQEKSEAGIGGRGSWDWAGPGSFFVSMPRYSSNKAMSRSCEMNALYVREALPQADAGIAVQEKLERCGVEALRDGELLILFLNITEEKAKGILAKSQLPELYALPFPALQKLLGKPKAARLVSSFELSKRTLQQGLGILPAISCPAETIPFLAGIKDKCKEHFLCLYLNARNQSIHQEVISIGSLSASIVHPREVFSVAVKHSAASIILAHNHPSGDCSPSKDDIELTRRLTKAGQIMGIEILDHIIISKSDFLSLKEKGLM